MLLILGTSIFQNNFFELLLAGNAFLSWYIWIHIHIYEWFDHLPMVSLRGQPESEIASDSAPQHMGISHEMLCLQFPETAGFPLASVSLNLQHSFLRTNIPIFSFLKLGIIYVKTLLRSHLPRKLGLSSFDISSNYEQPEFICNKTPWLYVVIICLLPNKLRAGIICSSWNLECSAISLAHWKISINVYWQMLFC